MARLNSNISNTERYKKWFRSNSQPSHPNSVSTCQRSTRKNVRQICTDLVPLSGEQARDKRTQRNQRLKSREGQTMSTSVCRISIACRFANLTNLKTNFGRLFTTIIIVCKLYWNEELFLNPSSKSRSLFIENELANNNISMSRKAAPTKTGRTSNNHLSWNCPFGLYQRILKNSCNV